MKGISDGFLELNLLRVDLADFVIFILALVAAPDTAFFNVVKIADNFLGLLIVVIF